MTKDTIFLDAIEYDVGSPTGELAVKNDVECCGVIQRKSDGFTVLSLKGGTRAHNIEVGRISSITINGTKHILKTESMPFRFRAAEIKAILGNDLSQKEAAYLNPADSDYYKNWRANAENNKKFWLRPNTRIIVILSLFIIYLIS